MKNTDKKITRREAIEKTGKYAAITAAATFMILSPKKSQAGSTSPGSPGWSKNEQKIINPESLENKKSNT